MSIVASIRSQLVPINHEGYPFIAAFGIASLILMWLWSPLGWLGVIATLWCVYFFRDPPRVTPLREGLVIAPADGRATPAMSIRPLLPLIVFTSIALPRLWCTRVIPSRERPSPTGTPTAT